MMRPFERLLALFALVVLSLLLWAGYALERTADLGAQEPAPPSAAIALPACESDDADNAPCVWQASEQGDGEGRSFVALPGADGGAPTVLYLEEIREVWTPRGVRELEGRCS